MTGDVISDMTGDVTGGMSGGMIEVLYEDNHVICVVKRPGTPSQPDASGAPDMLSMVKAHIKSSRGKPGEAFVGLAHRLDRPVGGVMAFAKTSKGAARLSAQIRERTFKKTYLAVLDGALEQADGVLRHIIRKPPYGGKVIVSDIPPDGEAVGGETVGRAVESEAVGRVGDGGKLAALEYRVIGRDEKTNKTLVAVNLITGKPHQIRAQFARVGFPVSGDRKYGRSNAYARTAVGAGIGSGAGAGRTHTREPQPALWAAEIDFMRATGGGRQVVRSSPPIDEYPWNAFVGAIAELGY